MVTPEEYKKAKKIVDEYDRQQNDVRDANLKALEQELTEFFKTNKLCYDQCEIKEFYLTTTSGFGGKHYAYIHSTIPMFDEDYSESDKMENDLNLLGMKHGFAGCSMESGAYGK